ncbi:MAG: hypothetical protein HUJ31_05365, partial [Pseudomonadales bacterium]|nr:hypothetical protein [Pseudomonadales bacterium]
MAVDEKLERCPKCGLVIAKWREKMDEEREKERLRRRMQRDERLKGDEEAQRKLKLEELERLRKREREIMEDLGMKVPGRFWQMFERYPGSIGTALTGVIIVLTAVALYYVDEWLDAREHAALVAAQPSEEIKQVAPLLASVVELGQTGNGRVISEVSDIARVLHGRSPEETDKLIRAAQQMMKGADNREFIDAALQPPAISTTTVRGEGEEERVQVNLDTIGGISGLNGVEHFDPAVLKKMAPPLLEHGHEEVLNIMEEKRLVPDPQDPEGGTIVVEEIDRLDGSMIVDLMKTLERDQEWDQFVLGHLDDFLSDERVEDASELANRIRNPVLRIEALGNIMAHVLLSGGTDLDLKVYVARIDIELERITNPDIKAMTTLSLGKKLAAAGSEEEPTLAMNMVSGMLAESPDPYEKAFLSSRLAIAHLDNGDRARGRRYFEQAINLAGQVEGLENRLSAFTRIARRYYDARNAPLANEILAETAILAATRLPPAERSRIFGEIAMAQGYMGDFDGAMVSIDNAGQEQARQQLLSKLAESLIGLGKPYLAQSVMARIDDNVEYNRLELRLISTLLHDGHLAEARDRLSRAQTRARQIE